MKKKKNSCIETKTNHANFYKDTNWKNNYIRR
jgi:hypothetical protein